MRYTITTLLFISAITAFAQSYSIDTHRVIGEEFPGEYKHPASITQLANGDLYIAYYSGAGEYSDETAVYGMRQHVRPGNEPPAATSPELAPNQRGVLQAPVPVRRPSPVSNWQYHWTTPEVIADTPNRGEGNPVVWQAPDGKVWLFYVNRYGDTWSNARVKVKTSDDGAHTWSDSFMLNFEEGTMARSQPIVLNDGDYLLPMYYETGNDREGTISSTVSYFLRYNPATKIWTETNRIQSPTGNIQAQVAQISDDYLVAYIRRGGNFEPTEDGYTLRSESRDGGHTWSDAVQSEFKNPNSAVDFIKLKNGHLLLVYNDNMNERTPLTVAISMDNDETYPYRRNIGGGDNTFAYPYAIQTRDEKIHIIYTTNERRTIMHATFDEYAIIGQPPEL